MHLNAADKENLANIKATIKADIRLHYRIEDLASMAFMSRSNLTKKYKAFYGISIYAELLQTRLALARQELETTETPIKVIAKKCGFKYACNFSIAFKARYGVRPREYRGI